ncbi:MAG: hypothetical protein ACLPND_11135, partial [Candidatus Korobacteraceae bacterium]
GRSNTGGMQAASNNPSTSHSVDCHAHAAAPRREDLSPLGDERRGSGPSACRVAGRSSEMDGHIME